MMIIPKGTFLENQYSSTVNIAFRKITVKLSFYVLSSPLFADIIAQ